MTGELTTASRDVRAVESNVDDPSSAACALLEAPMPDGAMPDGMMPEDAMPESVSVPTNLSGQPGLAGRPPIPPLALDGSSETHAVSTPPSSPAVHREPACAVAGGRSTEADAASCTADADEANAERRSVLHEEGLDELSRACSGALQPPVQ